MSQENVETVGHIYAAWSLGDFDTGLQAIHPDVEWYDPPEQPGPTRRQGHAGAEESIFSWVEAWDDYRYELRELVDAGDKVLAWGRQSGRGKDSRIEVSADLFHVWKMRNGKAVEVWTFNNRDEALRAVGLSE
jgi:ketosteroid isomerase-like protein